MNKFLYSRLAINNIKKNSKTYIPYIISSIFTIAMFYMMSSISQNSSLNAISGSETLKEILYFGTIIIALFSVIFLFYTNSFLIKRRKKEFGIYNILGMEKKHICKVIFLESLFTFITSMVIGILTGILFSKLMFLLLLKLLSFDVNMTFYIPITSVTLTIALFVGIFLLTFISNIFQIRATKPIQLLQDSHNGEKEPKTKWVLTVIGLISLASGYIISLSIETPLNALYAFFIAVVLVMIGTYALFTSGSIAVLKLLKRNKKYYYNPKHFTSISGMIYRMKQNAVGLANICILSTAVILVLSSTISLYTGIDDELKCIFPREINMDISQVSDNDVEQFDTIFDNTATQDNIDIENNVDYRYGESVLQQDGNSFTTNEELTYGGMSNGTLLMFIPLDDYNNSTGQNLSLSSNEVFAFSESDQSDLSTLGDNISLMGKTFNIKQNDVTMPLVDKRVTYARQCFCIVCDNINTVQELTENTISLMGTPTEVNRIIGFDTNNDEDLNNFASDLSYNLSQVGFNNGYEVKVRTDELQSFYSLYGCLFFVGIFLGILFLMVTVLIIYYKQISEGYDDKIRFEIMQKVGMSKNEVKKSIKNQILLVFFIPLICACIHIIFAFPIMTKLLEVMNLTNVHLFIACTIATIIAFSIIYALIYLLTARTYYKIVEK